MKEELKIFYQALLWHSIFTLERIARPARFFDDAVIKLSKFVWMEAYYPSIKLKTQLIYL